MRKVYLLYSTIYTDTFHQQFSVWRRTVRGNTLSPRNKRKHKIPRETVLCLPVTGVSPWDTVEQVQISQDCLRPSAFRFQGECAAAPEWKLCPLPSMLMQAGKLPSVRRLPCSPSLFAPKGTTCSEETGVLHKHYS